MKFQVGDRVRLIIDRPDGGNVFSGDEGIVRCINNDLFSRPIGVEFDRYIDGHDLYMDEGLCKEGYGWYVYETEIELVDTEIQPPTDEELRSLLGLGI